MEKSKKMTAEDAKLKGGKFYKIGNYKEAHKCYSQAISLIESDLSNESKSIYYSNRANSAFFLNPSDYSEVIRDCNLAIRFNKNNIKPYYRKVISFIKEEEPCEADNFLKEMRSLFTIQSKCKI